MAIRLEQIHPTVVHLPIAFLPLAIGADLLGAATGSAPMRGFGRKAIAVAAVGAVASAVTGLIAGEEVNVEGASRDKLMTHRNLNAIVTIVASTMAIWRSRREQPNTAYLATGLAGMGILAYTAYLGGQLVYESGVGVGPAKGVYRPDAPVLKRRQTGRFIKDATVGLAHGAQHMVQEVRQGYIAPSIAGKRAGE
jgi:uncharacterized membrane protein